MKKWDEEVRSLSSIGTCYPCECVCVCECMCGSVRVCVWSLLEMCFLRFRHTATPQPPHPQLKDHIQNKLTSFYSRNQNTPVLTTDNILFTLLLMVLFLFLSSVFGVLLLSSPLQNDQFWSWVSLFLFHLDFSFLSYFITFLTFFSTIMLVCRFLFHNFVFFIHPAAILLIKILIGVFIGTFFIFIEFLARSNICAIVPTILIFKPQKIIIVKENTHMIARMRARAHTHTHSHTHTHFALAISLPVFCET